MSAKKKILSAIGLIIVLLIITVVSVPIFRSYDYNKQKKSDLAQLSTAEYNSIFCSMYSIENFAQEDFITYRGVNTLKLPTVLRSTGDMGEYLTAAFDSGNSVEIVYLGLDPAQIWSSVGKKIDKWNSALTEDIMAYATAHPEVTFEILLPAPSLNYWTEKSIAETEEILTTYQSLISTLDPYSNISTYFMGGEHWLIANPDNYTAALTTNPLISQKIFLFTFCDHEYQINAANVTEQLDALKALIAREKETPTSYPDLSGWDVVFFGDSIIGNYTGSYSVPGVVTGLSDAHTYNCAQGGIPASEDANSLLSFPSSVDYFMEQDSSAILVDGPFPSSLEDYVQEDHDQRKLCFVLNFGLNDYFGGHPVANAKDPFDTATYAGALREGIHKLQTAYPEAKIVLMTPNFVSIFNNGTDTMSENGSILTEYVDAAVEVANDMNVICLNNYTDLGINESNASSLLADGVHLNETGRFRLAERIIWELACY